MALQVKSYGEAKDIVAAVEALAGNKVLVGVPSTTAGRKTGTITNATIAYVQNFGNAKLNIPAREFMYSGMEAGKAAAISHLWAAAKFAMAGDRDGAIQALIATGIAAQNAIRRKITTGPFIPLAKATLAARKAKGRMGERPLVETGQLRRSITYVIRGKWF